MSGRPIVMPKLGLTMTEGVVAEWRVAAGDAVKVGDILVVVETDKIANEVEADAAGVIETLHVAEGAVVPVGATLATFTASGESAPLVPASATKPAVPVAAPVVAHPDRYVESDRHVATPLARRIAAKAGLDLAAVIGSGPRGRIVADDIETAIRNGRREDKATPPAATAASALTGALRPLGAYQKVAARRLTEAKRDIPHFYVLAEVDVTDLLAARASLNAAGGGIKLSVTHFLIAAVARALAATPTMNRVWADEQVLELAQVDIGLAIEGPKGLVAPVLCDLAGSTVDDVAEAATRLVKRARQGRLGAAELQGGATTISNVGMFGATALIPIINPGQSSILGVGASRPQFLPDKYGQPRLRQLLNLALSCDHRVIDGALAARFLQQVQTRLEAPLQLLRTSRETAP